MRFSRAFIGLASNTHTGEIPRKGWACRTSGFRKAPLGLLHVILGLFDGMISLESHLHTF